MDRTTPVVWVADVGSVAAGRFAWCRAESRDDAQSGIDMAALVTGVTEDICAGRPVALGFECPLFVPVPSGPEALCRARQGDGNRAWSSGAGCAALATGLSESAWIFSRLAQQPITILIRPTFHWRDFRDGEANLFIWEAFVSGAAKGDNHGEDARIAADSFWSAYPRIDEENAVAAENPFSIAGAALLRSGLVRDTGLLSQPCVVIKSFGVRVEWVETSLLSPEVGRGVVFYSDKDWPDESLVAVLPGPQWLRERSETVEVFIRPPHGIHEVPFVAEAMRAIEKYVSGRHARSGRLLPRLYARVHT